MSVVVSRTDDEGGRVSIPVALESQGEGAQSAPPLFTEQELDELEESYVDKAETRIRGINEDRFGLGELAFELDEKVRDGAKRAPDNYDAYSNLARKLTRRGLYQISGKRLRAFSWAYRTRNSLGGKDKAPDLPIDHFVEVSHAGLKQEDQRELLEIAAEKQLSASALRRFVTIRLGNTENTKTDADKWPAQIEQDISKVVSIIAESFCIAEDRGYDLPQYTRDRLVHTAILITLFSRHASNPNGMGGVND